MADSLEAEWNEKLRGLQNVREEYERRRESDRLELDETKKAKIRELVRDVPRLWRDPRTPARERKRMVRLLIEDATLLKGEEIAVHVRFRGGATRSLKVLRARSSWELRQIQRESVTEIDRLLEDHTYGEVARILNERGLTSGTGRCFDGRRVNGDVVLFHDGVRGADPADRGPTVHAVDLLLRRLAELGWRTVTVERGPALEEARTFVKTCGGAVANVAVGCARLGLKTAFIGKVGDDPFGGFLRRALEESGVNTRGLVLTRDHETPIVFVSLDERSRPSFFFHGRPSADLMLEPVEVDLDLVRSTRFLHFGTVSLCAEPARSATLHAVEAARGAGVLVSYDPNVRLHMWKDRDEAIDWSRRMIGRADLVKMSDEEAEMLLGTRDPAVAAEALLGRGPRLALVTMGPRGAVFACAGGSGHVPAPRVDAVDTTGAGDAFVAGLLCGLAGMGGSPFDDPAGIREAARRVCAAAALTTEAIGAISAMPDRGTLDEALAGRFAASD